MPRRIHPDFQYVDPHTGERDGRQLDLVKLADHITKQNSGHEPVALGFGEIAEKIGVTEPTAVKIIQRHALSTNSVSPINSCFTVLWANRSNGELIEAKSYENDVPRGAKPVILDSQDIVDGIKRYARGKWELASGYGKQGGRGNKKTTRIEQPVRSSIAPSSRLTDVSSGDVWSR